MNEPIHLIANRWQCPDGTILQSKYKHDYVSHIDITTGELCTVGGGLDYHIYATGNLKDMCVMSNDPHEEKREAFMWDCAGLFHGCESPQWKALKDLTTEEIWLIIKDYQDYTLDHFLQLFREELRFREENNANNSELA